MTLWRHRPNRVQILPLGSDTSGMSSLDSRATETYLAYLLSGQGVFNGIHGDLTTAATVNGHFTLVVGGPKEERRQTPGAVGAKVATMALVCQRFFVR